MGTISEKLTYLNGTKQLLKGKINNLGGSIDDNTTFRNYANQLQNVYDNLPKTEYQEGIEVNLGVTSKGKLDFENGVVGIGQSSQDSTQGYQLIDRSKGGDSFTYHGITTTFNQDGSVTMKGTTSEAGNVDGLLIGNWGLTTKFMDLDTSSQYVLKLAGNTNNKLGVILVNGNSVISSSFNTPSIFTPSYDGATLLMVRYANATQGENIDVTIYPMLSKGNDTSYPFEQYTGGQASPNPSYPQTINSVTGNQDVVVSGKNKLGNLTDVASTEVSGITYAISNNQISVNGTATASQNTKMNTINFTAEANKTYTFAFIIDSLSGGSPAINFLFGTDAITNKVSLPINNTTDNKVKVVTLTEDFTFTRLSLYIGDSGPVADFKGKLMIVEGEYTSSTIGDYEPYITPTSYQLSLGDIELNAIGNYKDYIYKSGDKWYKKEHIKKVVFNGSETGWDLQSVNDYGIANMRSALSDYNSTEQNLAFCDLFSSQESLIANEKNEGFYINFNKNIFVRIKSTRASTANEFITWLSNNNMTLYYVLATANDIEITDTTLIEQLNAWYNAHSNNGTTIITSNGNLPMIIKVRALKGE